MTRRSDQWRDYEEAYGPRKPLVPCDHKLVVNLGQTREYCIKCLKTKEEIEKEKR